LASSSVSATSTASRGAAPACYPVDPQRSSNQDWKERFIRLQAFLRNNEQSGQEEYIHSKFMFILVQYNLPQFLSNTLFPFTKLQCFGLCHLLAEASLPLSWRTEQSSS
jgi:hypothetical protein